ncbi:hypothetical protein CLAFUW4_06703 [Fulvia fulva]|uniref:ASST-domain-containing protein n=1 Tax=Passalora fulva TaxID=5499 RepID=A0A9Q8UQT8_PASFU|nr:uncharacterized protein CLAFUR5_06845 [Fulvia fulva]KAK4622142.1 hypothetical protein CLAFUR4_06711 [Fulvia fulva]UJO19016.1 hypothetical protein CLAFUR5_06845 [Fulvia fulva]WPV16478.1 hypothetical protein CLAFUW4_06703 [Fulvia fulva]WPV31327.1 hypothetical protein CLAFUW7_06702 [Fulvia fulva]
MRFDQFTSLAALISTAAADWQFRSRPDLALPRLNITIPAQGRTEQGYLFVAPFAGQEDTSTAQYRPRQAGPYISRDNGDLIWSGYSYYSIWATNFQKVSWNGRDVLACFEGDHNPNYGHGHGHTTFLDEHYETVRELRAGKHKLMDKHEFQEIGGKTGLIQIYQPGPRDLSKYAKRPSQRWIVNAIFQELNLDTGEVLFEWSSLDHVSPEESVLPIDSGIGQAGPGYNSSDAWDYFHINSVDKDSAGNYLISARDAYSIHKINGTDGSIIWRLDGKRSDFQLGEGVKFCFQHHARFLEQDGDVEIISLYDNSAHGTESGKGKEVRTAKTSSGKILKLNTTSWTAELVHGYYPPDGLLSKSQGSTQVLPNTNVLVNWGSEGAVTEFLPDGTAIFHAYMDSGALGEGVQNYRAYRYRWTGLPNEEPAIASFYDSSGTSIYISWNGDTETKSWRFLELADDGEEDVVLGEVERTSFETVLRINDGGYRTVGKVWAVAIDESGKVLRGTDVVQSLQNVEPVSHDEETAGRYCLSFSDTLRELIVGRYCLIRRRLA